MLKEVRKVTIEKEGDNKGKVIESKTRSFVNPFFVSDVDEVKTDDDKCPIIYLIHMNGKGKNSSFLLAAKDFRKLHAVNENEILPPGSFKTK